MPELKYKDWGEPMSYNVQRTMDYKCPYCAYDYRHQGIEQPKDDFIGLSTSPTAYHSDRYPYAVIFQCFFCKTLYWHHADEDFVEALMKKQELNEKIKKLNPAEK